MLAYNYYRCRCDKCRAANREYHLAWVDQHRVEVNAYQRDRQRRERYRARYNAQERTG
jgi:hypothetical protein